MASKSSPSPPPPNERQHSTQHYQTFPTPPPKGKGARQSFGSADTAQSSDHRSPQHSRNASASSHHSETPLPKGQLAVLAIIALCEQTALNSISPYLPEMVARFPEGSIADVGLHTGQIASAFALAQFLTNYFWGWLSDRIGRKPVVLMGTALTAACFVGFGFSTHLWHAIVVQFIMGFVNGNQGVISTCLGELTDKSNQSRAFTYLPVIYGLGGITGPALGGLLSDRGFKAYPYLLPNLLAAALLTVDLVISSIFLKESLDEMKGKPGLGRRINSMFASVWQFVSSAHRPTYVERQAKGKQPQEASPLLADGSAVENSDDEDDDDSDDDVEPVNPRAIMPSLRSRPTLQSLASLRSVLPAKPDPEVVQQLYTRNTILLLITFLVFQLANISFNSLYPIFAQAAEPVGRNLSPQVIGLSLAFAGIATIVFQVGIFGRLKDRMGNKKTWRVSLGIFVVAFGLMPFIPYKGPDELGVRHDIFRDFYGTGLLYIFLGIVLLLKTIAAIGGLTSALLLITNSAPSPAVLGTLNGLAQTLSAGGRAIGPFASGGLFSLAFRMPVKGEALPFGIFAGITLLGFALSFGIRGEQLESEEHSDGESGDGDDSDSGSDDHDPDDRYGRDEERGSQRRG